MARYAEVAGKLVERGGVVRYVGRGYGLDHKAQYTVVGINISENGPDGLSIKEAPGWVYDATEFEVISER